MIPGEGPASGICAMQPRGQPDDQELRIRITEGCHRLAVVLRMQGFSKGQIFGNTGTPPAVFPVRQ